MRFPKKINLDSELNLIIAVSPNANEKNSNAAIPENLKKHSTAIPNPSKQPKKKTNFLNSF